MTTIRQTVEANIDRSYIQHGERAIRALEQREAQAVSAIRTAAERAGLDRSSTEDVLINAGLVERPAQAASGGSGNITLEGIAQQLTALNRRLDSASQQAARHGVRF